MPALISCTQALGEPRYPSLKGIMAARSKEIATRSLADLGIDPATVGGGGRHDDRPRQQDAAGTRRDRGRARHARRRRGADRRVPRQAAGDLMGELWVVGEPGPDGGLARLSTEAATLARDLGGSSGHDVVGDRHRGGPVRSGRRSWPGSCRGWSPLRRSRRGRPCVVRAGSGAPGRPPRRGRHAAGPDPGRRRTGRAGSRRRPVGADRSRRPRPTRPALPGPTPVRRSR